ncbi:alpha/beta hydrolase [Streptosporangium sp. NPDC006013]|uniref:alpha/beta hydrolase n=1 Tax=Streptosporangium sp. NPDC006013 TaxID=3155596 RepID=UPI0033A8950A
MAVTDSQSVRDRLDGVVRRYRTPAGLVAGASGVLIGIYSDDAREVIGLVWGYLSEPAPLLACAGLGISALTWKARGVIERRRESRRRIVSESMDIRTVDFDDDLPNDQAVIGRELHYLERVTESSTLVILLHGLGLDANDFRPYMNIAHEHTAAITLFGFNTREAGDGRYRPIGLTTHAELVNGAINSLQRKYPQKKLALVGFSVGADMILRLGELWQDHPARKPKVAALLLLDPNINHSSMVVSGGFAQMDPEQPLAELKRISQIPTDLIEFQNISEYLHKISKKDLAQIQKHAKDWWEYWEEPGRYDLFLQRLDRLRSLCPRIKIFFSDHYDQYFNEIVAKARQKDMVRIFDLFREDHFELLNEKFIEKNVSALIAQSRRSQSP